MNRVYEDELVRMLVDNGWEAIEARAFITMLSDMIRNTHEQSAQS